LIGVDSSLAEVESAAPRLLRLLAPSDSVMDLNIGAALWLAAEADGVLLGAAEGSGKAPQRYRSAARVVLLGHGADELFAGYSRHRTRFRAASWPGLAAELALDVRRLWLRNLGRDDRLVADRGREARHPFLDEDLVAEALALPLPALADLALPAGTGDKRVLRQALVQLGLPRAAARVKRAIQFGSRLAKAHNVAHFGGTRQANARSAGSVKLAQLALPEGVLP
jgi:asparagine synthetase B (glutamine-hydrolysing)